MLGRKLFGKRKLKVFQKCNLLKNFITFLSNFTHFKNLKKIFYNLPIVGNLDLDKLSFFEYCFLTVSGASKVISIEFDFAKSL